MGVVITFIRMWRVMTTQANVKYGVELETFNIFHGIMVFTLIWSMGDYLYIINHVVTTHLLREDFPLILEHPFRITRKSWKNISSVISVIFLLRSNFQPCNGMMPVAKGFKLVGILGRIHLWDRRQMEKLGPDAIPLTKS